MTMHLRGHVLPDGEARDLWIDGGVVTFDPIPGAPTIVDGGWIVPGLVDAHCHIGIKFGGGNESIDGCIEQARHEVSRGVLLVRDAGSPVDTRSLDEVAGLPTILRAGQHIALYKRYIPGLGIALEDESQLVETVVQEARRGDGWVKLVGDWIDRTVGDLAPLWSDSILAQAISAAHAEGARVTAHVFGTEALYGLLEAGIDCIEHGCGLNDELISSMVERDVALVPTLINTVENFPGIADSAGRFPTFAAHIRKLHAGLLDSVGAAHDAGVRIYAGTDAGGLVHHGRIADEVLALTRAGLSGEEAVAAASWAARAWLEQPTISGGASADFVVYDSDPREDPGVLSKPRLIVLRGQLVST